MAQVSRALVVAFTLTLALGLAVMLPACSEEDAAVASADIEAELEALRDQIEAATAATERHRSGLLAEISDTRREVLLLSAAMLENRLIAEQGGTPTEVVAPISTPDPARAEQLLRHIAAAEEEREKIEDAAAQRDGMAGSLSQTAIATLELTIAQLRQAYFEAAYGLAVPQSEKDGTLTAAAAPPLITSAPPAAGDTEAATPSAGKAAAGAETADSRPTTQVAATPPQAPAEPRSYGGADYLRIQKLLKQFGFDPGPVDGQWGPKTRRALTDFQASAGLPPTGEPDPASLDALGFD
jgi:hypothetical protein